MKSIRLALLRSLTIAILAVSSSGGWLSSAFAQTNQRADASEMSPPRVGMVTGDASFWRPGASDWSPAQVNTPLAAGDSLYTADGATLEVQIGTRAYVRLAQRAMLQLLRNDGGVLQLKISSGIAALDLRNLQSGRSIELDTPSGVFSIDSVGYYRVEVSDSSTNIIVRRGGDAVATLADGSRRMIAPSQEAVVDNGDSSRDIETYVAPDADAWDQWNYARTDDLIDAISNRYVSPDVYGADDLDHYGNWRVTPDYGPVWIPSGMASDWAPYSTGAWVWDPVYEWTWVDARPWGWAPYHYGRWVNINGYWAWAPGPRVVRPAYAPALVAFFHAGGGAVASFGGPGVSWVALSWGEPVLPWWGRQRHNFVGRPSWGGWGGPRVINNVVIHNNTVINNVNVTNIRYRNSDQRNAVVAVREDNFGHGPINGGATRVEPVHMREWRPAGPNQIRPGAASMSPVQSKAVVPTQATVNRPVVVLHDTPMHMPPSRPAGQQAGEAQRPAMNKDRVITNRPQGGQNTPWASFGKATGPERAEPRHPPEPPRSEEWTPQAAPQVQEPRQVARPAMPEPVRLPQQQQQREPGRIIDNEPPSHRESLPATPPAIQEQRQMPRAVVPQQVVPQLRQEPPAMVNSPSVQREIQSPVPPRERPQEPREQRQQQREQREQPRNESRSEAPRSLPGQPANQLFQRREAHAEQPQKAEQQRKAEQSKSAPVH